MKKVSYNKYRKVIREYHKSILLMSAITVILFITARIGFGYGIELLTVIATLIGLISLIFTFHIIYSLWDYRKRFKPKDRIRDFGNIWIFEMEDKDE